MSYPFASNDNGTLLVCGDGPELMVYTGPEPKPMWQHFCNDLIAFVGVVSGDVLCVETSGAWSLRDAGQGRSLREGQIDGPISGLVFAGGPTWGYFNEHGIHRVESSARTLVDEPNIVQACLDGSGNLLCVGRTGGEIAIVEATHGEVMGRLEVGAEIASVGWSALGYWIVLTSSELMLTDATATQIVAKMTLPNGAVTSMSCSKDGSIVALASAAQTIELITLDDQVCAGTVTFERDLGPVVMLTGKRLAVGLDDGEVTVVEWMTQKVLNSHAHHGRTKTLWKVQPKVNVAALRGAMARAQTGGGPIAAAYVPPKEEIRVPKSNHKTLLLVGAVVLVFFGCCGCSCLGFFLRG